MRRGYEPVQTWAIMMKDGCAEVIVDFWKPARPVDALLKSPLDGSAAVEMDLHVAGVDRYPLYLPKRSGDKDCQKHDEKHDKESKGDPVHHTRSIRSHRQQGKLQEVGGTANTAAKR